VGAVVDLARIRDLVRARLLGDEPGRLESLSAPQRRVAVQGAVMDVLREERAILPAGSLAQVVNEVSDEVVGLGPIERLLKDPEVSEGNLTKRGPLATSLVHAGWPVADAAAT
jgi:hypothetical protein